MLTPEQETLLKAIERADSRTFEEIMEGSIDVNFLVNGTSPLHMAAMYANNHFAESLLQHGAQVDFHDGHGNTPLQVSILHLITEGFLVSTVFPILTVLINNGADTSAIGLLSISFADDPNVSSMLEEVYDFVDSLVSPQEASGSGEGGQAPSLGEESVTTGCHVFPLSGMADHFDGSGMIS